MNITDMQFHRLFSKTMYKNLRLPLGEMTFTKDFITDTRGDLYPIIEKSTDCTEEIAENRWLLKKGAVERRMGAFFPYASYEVSFDLTAGEGSCGFAFRIPEAAALVSYDGSSIRFRCGDTEARTDYRHPDATITLIVTCRPAGFDIYAVRNRQPQFICSFRAEAFANANQQKSFERGYTSLIAEGELTVEGACFYIDCGISQADIRPIKYENGDVMIEQGKIYLTASVRLQEGGFQGVFSWIPGTSVFDMTGALFYDSGDGCWCGDVAASLRFHREHRAWYLWVCAFSHGHMLGHAKFEGDPRFGVNVIDIELMKKGSASDSLTDFVGFEGDEDPDFYYDTALGRWRMAICRIDRSINAYRYVFFESEHPFEGYSYIGQGYDGAETGGSFAVIGGERVFVCGNDFAKTSNYRIYSEHGMTEAAFDFPDGGFRGWGTVIPLKLGSRVRLFWLTFDRHNGSSYNWSYGNLYCFEAIE